MSAKTTEVKAPGHDRRSAIVVMLATAVLFSTGGAAVKLSSLSAWQLAGSRSIVAAVVLAALLAQTRSRWSLGTWAIGSAYAATLVLFVHANKLTTAASAIFLQGTAPFWVILISPVVLRERPQRRDLLLAGTMAVAMLVIVSDRASSVATAPDPLLGNGLALLSGASYALVIVGLRWLSVARSADEHEGLRAVVCGNLLAGIGCLPGMWGRSADEMLWTRLAQSPTDIVVVLYLGVFQIGLAYWLMVRAVGRLRAVQTALLLLLEPILSPFWAAWVVGELPGRAAWIGGVLVVAATAWHALRAVEDEARPGHEILRE